MIHSLIVDDWLFDFEGWRRWCDTLEYVSEVNPVDGVAYPGIYKDVPTWGAQQRLEAIFGPVTINSTFLRLSLAGFKVPHQAHHDASMGEFSLMVYMNRPEDCRGGTSLLRHIWREPDQETWERDTNRPEQWEIVSLCEMRPNRAFIFRSDLWHRAEPIGGYGSNSHDGRLVLTAFFSCK